jgi:hypothetical protein
MVSTSPQQVAFDPFWQKFALLHGYVDWMCAREATRMVVNWERRKRGLAPLRWE